MDYFEDHCWADVVSPELLEIYKPYRRRTYVGPRPALLVIDLYRLAYEGGARPVMEVIQQHKSASGLAAWNAIEPTQRLLQACRAAGLPIFYCTVQTSAGAQGDGSVSATERQGETPTARDFEIFEAFAPQRGDVIVYKQRASIFYGTPLVAHLVRRGIDSLIVCGESTSGCVRASVVDAYSNGYHVTVAEECVFDRGELNHKVSLFDLHHKYADVMHLEEILEHLKGLTAG